MRHALLCTLALACAGCLELPSLPSPHDASRHDAASPAPSFEILGLDVRDPHGTAWRSDAMPRSPAIALTFTLPPANPEEILLVRGALDDALASDLDTAPYRADTRARAVAAEARLDGDRVIVRPFEPLVAGETLTLAVPAWIEDDDGDRLPSPRTFTLVVSTRSDAGARALDAWPPDGAFEVTTELALAAVRFDGALADPARAVQLVDGNGYAAPCAIALEPCASIGWTEGTCVVMRPSMALSASTPYELRVASGALDTTGAEIPAFTARFSTAAGTPAPLALVPVACTALGETEVGGACAEADDESVVLRAQLSAAARIAWRAASHAGTALAPRGEVSIRLEGLAADSALTLAIDAIDMAGATIPLAFAVATTPPLAPFSITEVRAYPAGTQPRQEYVEIANVGSASTSLSGLFLSTSTTSSGEALPDVLVAPGQRVLVVPATFDPTDLGAGLDAPVPAATVLVRLHGSIGGRGLSDAGVPVFLRDADHHRVSRAPATPAPRRAVCIVRTSASWRAGDDGTFGYAAGDTCTPGR
jgi:hypothetical protein